MIVQSIFFYVILLSFLVPILLAGFFIIRRVSIIDRFELLFPIGSILGISFFVVCLNLNAFLIKGIFDVLLSYILIIAVAFYFYVKGNLTAVNYPKGKDLFFYIVSVSSWAIFLIWKGNHALIGSDTNLYFAIAHTFIKGNFFPLTPWQPNLVLSYHLGASELLGAFYLFTNLSFEFLHIFFSCLFIFFSAQIIIWIWARHDKVTSFIWGNVVATLTLVSFGFIKIIVPIAPLDILSLTNPHKLFLWIRDLPTVNQSIEVYGAPINLDALIYFIFHSFGLSLILALICILIYSVKEKIISTWFILLVGLSSLALVNEAIFIVSAPVLILGGLLKELQHQTFFKNLKFICLIVIALIISAILQGGIITNSIFSKDGLEKSVLIIPKKSDIKEDFISYHYYQEISKRLSIKGDLHSFIWFHIGVDLLIVISLIGMTFLRLSIEQKLLTLMFFLIGLLSLLAYNLIVPKFLVANGNRFLALSFLFLSLSITLPLQNLRKSILITVSIFIILPTILPPLFLLSKNRFGENKLIPKREQQTAAINWMERNISYDKRVVVLDVRSPHPSGQTRAMVQAGVFTPLFPGDFRAYTIEASPEYLDIAYYLSPQALKKLKIEIILLDSYYYENLLPQRKEQLKNIKYFETLFVKENTDHSWEKIFKVKPEYLNSKNELPGTIEELQNENLLNGRIYIDNEENFNPSFLRRAIIFSLRKKDLYYLPQSGVYLNVESSINSHYPVDSKVYDFLILGKNTKPEDVCKCEATLIWKGLKNEIFIWKKD